MNEKAKIKTISTTHAPKAVGPYVQATKCENFIFVSGQLPINAEDDEMIRGSYSKQAEQSMKNIEAILKESGMGFDDLVKTTIYITNMDKFSEVNEVYKGFFKNDYYPARACVEVSKLPKEALVEIEAIGFKLNID